MPAAPQVVLTIVSIAWIAEADAERVAHPDAAACEATATAPLPMPMLPGVIGNRAGDVERGQDHERGEQRVRQAEAPGRSRAFRPAAPAAMPTVHAITLASARGERTSAVDAVEQVRDPRHASAGVTRAAPRSRHGDSAADEDEHRPQRHRAVSATQRRQDLRVRAIASRRVPHRRRRSSRVGRATSIAREQSAIFTASPSFAGANALTSEPTPRRAAACRGQMRAPALVRAPCQAPTVQQKAARKASAATPSQGRLASVSASNAGASRPPSWATATEATRAASPAAERASDRRERVMVWRSIPLTPHPRVELVGKR